MNTLTIRPERLERLREICLSMPDAAEKEAFGDPTWRIRDRIFATQKGNYEGGRPSLWIKADDGVQAALVESDPKTFFVPPYVGKKGWIAIYLDGRVRWSAIAALIEESHRLVASRPQRRSGAKKRPKRR